MVFGATGDVDGKCWLANVLVVGGGSVVLHFPSASQLTSFWALLLSAVYLAGFYVNV